MTNSPIAPNLHLMCAFSYLKAVPSQRVLNHRENISIAFWTFASSVVALKATISVRDKQLGIALLFVSAFTAVASELSL